MTSDPSKIDSHSIEWEKIELIKKEFNLSPAILLIFYFFAFKDCAKEKKNAGEGHFPAEWPRQNCRFYELLMTPVGEVVIARLFGLSFFCRLKGPYAAT